MNYLKSHSEGIDNGIEGEVRFEREEDVIEGEVSYEGEEDGIEGEDCYKGEDSFDGEGCSEGKDDGKHGCLLSILNKARL